MQRIDVSACRKMKTLLGPLQLQHSFTVMLRLLVMVSCVHMGSNESSYVAQLTGLTLIYNVCNIKKKIYGHFVCEQYVCEQIC